ncbi:MAG: ATP-binding protein, partial [Anaerolineae bacterium]
MTTLTLRLLGPPLIELNGCTVQLGRRKALALLAYLALTRQPHSRDALATLLWPELDQSRARGQLRRTLSLLKRRLGEEWLAIDRETAQWAPEGEAWIDMERFRECLAECAAHGHLPEPACTTCVPLLSEAIGLYQDGFLSGFTLPDAPAFDEWQFFEGEALRDQVADALQRLVRWHGERGEHEAAIPYARRWLALDPLHEPAQRELMALYARSGQRAAALRQYGECERVLEEELGIPPSPETVQLYERIRDRDDLRGTRSLRATSVAENGFLTNLPAQSTPFVGREQELAELGRLLADPDVRLVTVLGPGGSGKTRLALEAAAGALGSYEHGVYLASLAPLRSADSIVPTIGQAIGFSFYRGGEPKGQLLAYLREKRMLLLLDNYEHLLGGAGLVADMLRAAPGIKLLVTSRATLNVPGEQLFSLAGMDYPAGAGRDAAPPPPDPDETLGYSAIALFVESARRVQPRFRLTAENVHPVIEICEFVQGMPLGILLAAAWTQMLAPAEVVRQLEPESGQGLDLLEPGWRGVPERHRSMRGVFDHSWRLLSGRQQQVLAGLSVFRGGLTLEAARAVADATLHDLRALLSSSLLQRTPGGRYEVHELLRQYAEGRLEATPAEAEAARERHSAYYLAALERWEAALKGPEQLATLQEMDAEINNVRAAWEWAVERKDAERLNQALGGLCLYHEWRERHREAEAMLGGAAEALDAIVAARGASSPPPVAVRALAKILAQRAAWISEHEVARASIERCMTLLTDAALNSPEARRDRAVVLANLGAATIELDVERTRAYFQESLALYRALGDRWGAATALNNLTFVAWYASNYDDARQRGYQSLEISRSLGAKRSALWATTWLMSVAWCQGEIEEFERLRYEHEALARAFGDRGSAASVHLGRGNALLLQGKHAEADAAYEASLAIHRELGTDIVFARVTSFRSLASIWAGAYDRARAQAQRALEMAQERDATRYEFCGHAHMALGRAALAEAAWADAERLFTKGLAIYVKGRQEDSQGQALACLALAARGLGRHAEARQYLGQALRISLKTRGMIATAIALAAGALLLCDAGETERAIEIYALATHHPFAANSAWFEDVCGRQIAAA